MSWLKLTNFDSGAPALAGVNGSLSAVLDWALPQAGWEIEFSTSNARVYRPGTGRRRRLYVNHDSAMSGSAALATARGCESAVSATNITDPFPTVAQIANNASTWHISTAASAVERNYVIYLSETFLILLIDCNSTGIFSMAMFGDVPPLFAEDEWNTIIQVRNLSTLTTANTGTTGIGSPTSSTIVATNHIFWCRSIDGSLKSTHGGLNASGANLGNVVGTPTPRGGYQNRIYREKVRVNCLGSTSTSVNTPLSLLKRGSIPNLWNPLHIGIGGLTVNDTFTDEEYDEEAIFRMFPSGSTPVCIIEETETWDAA